MDDELQRILDGSGSGLVEEISWTREHDDNHLVRTACVPAEIRIEHLSNTTLECLARCPVVRNAVPAEEPMELCVATGLRKPIAAALSFILVLSTLGSIRRTTFSLNKNPDWNDWNGHLIKLRHEDNDNCLLECDTMLAFRSFLTFRKSIWPPSSGG
jgi:hypothetical protein